MSSFGPRSRKPAARVCPVAGYGELGNLLNAANLETKSRESPVRTAPSLHTRLRIWQWIWQ
jgi:hypothetical protein